MDGNVISSGPIGHYNSIGYIPRKNALGISGVNTTQSMWIKKSDDSDIRYSVELENREQRLQKKTIECCRY